MALNPLLNYCSLQHWQPRHLDASGENSSSAELASDEARAALEAGRPDLCLGLIQIAQALDLHSVEQLELKAAALSMQQRQSQNPDAETAAIAAGDSKQDLLTVLLDACAARHWAPQFLSSTLETAPLAELETQALKEAEAARNNGAVELSLSLMDLSLQHGCRSLWILHNKALALSHLQRFDLAHHLWQRLIQHHDIPAFVAVAEAAFKTSEQREQCIKSTPLLQTLIGRIQQANLKPQVLPSSGELSDEADLQTLILQEAEKQRNQDQAQLSLDLLNIALDYGCDSLWLYHNKALALQRLGQLETAITSWEGLSHHQLDEFQKNVLSALEEAEQDVAIIEAKQIAESGSIDTAIDKLINTLIKADNPVNVEKELKTLFRQRRLGNTESQENSPLGDQQDELELNQILLNKVSEYFQ